MKLDPALDGPILSEVFDRYGWSPSRVRYVRGVLRVRTGDGEFALKKTHAPAENLRLITRVSEALREEGYEHLLPFVKTRDGEPFAGTEQGNWYALPWYGKSMDQGDEVPADELIRQLARFHRLSQPLVNEEKSPVEPPPAERSKRWEEWKGNLAEWREVADSREFTSPFDRAFQEHYEFLDKSFRFSLQGVDRLTVSGTEPSCRTLVHRRLHPQNLLVGEEGWRWIDWDHAAVGSPAGDIAAFLRRFVRVEEEVLDPSALLEEYEKEWKLTGQEKKLLALSLACPERPVRLLHHYYTLPREFEEAAAVRRLEEEVDRLHVFQDWIRTEWKPKTPRQQTGEGPPREKADAGPNGSPRRRRTGKGRRKNG